MTTRRVDLFDLPTLYRNRASFVGLDTALLLADGNPLSLQGTFSRTIPLKKYYTVIDGDLGSVLGSISIDSNGPSSRLSFLSAADEQYDERFLPVIDELCIGAGQYGAFHIVAEVQEDCEAWDILRKTGFSVYTTQKTYEINSVGNESGGMWKRAGSVERSTAQHIYEHITSPMIQAIQPFSANYGKLWQCDHTNIFAWVLVGRYGVVVNPIAHPDEKDTALCIGALSAMFARSSGKPIFVILKATLGWLEPAISNLGGKEIRKDGILVKHLANFVYANEKKKAPNSQGVTILSSHIKRND